MTYSNHDRKQERKRNIQFPTLSDWVNEPFSTALDLFGKPMDLLSRPLKDWWEGVVPNVDVSENDKEVNVRVEVPGMDEKELNVSYSQGILLIEGEKKIEAEHEKGQAKIRESKYGSFRREIPLGTELKWDESKATCKSGVLKITIPKSEKNIGSKKINIE